MFEKFTSHNIADFRQRYEGTYGFFSKKDGQRLLCKLSYIRENVCVFVDRQGLEYKLNPDSEEPNIGFWFLPPKAKWYNTDLGAVLVKRKAQRQFQRGVSAKNTTLQILQEKSFADLRVDIENLERVYTKALAPALAVKDRKQVPSIALSDNVAWSFFSGKVYVLDQNIGKMEEKDDVRKITLDEPALWRTEIMDAFRNANLSVEVV